MPVPVRTSSYALALDVRFPILAIHVCDSHRILKGDTACTLDLNILLTTNRKMNVKRKKNEEGRKENTFSKIFEI